MSKPTTVHFESCPDERFFLSSAGCERNDSGKRRRNALLGLMYYVIRNELTDKQREYLLLVKIKGFSIKQVADMKGVASSTVCRSLKASQKILDKSYEHFRCVSKFVDWSDTE